MSLPDLAGLVGVAMIVVAYAGVQLNRFEPRATLSLLLNFFGASLVLVSLLFRFNLSAFAMEAVWALIALYGLVRLAVRRFNRSGRMGGTPRSPDDRPRA